MSHKPLDELLENGAAAAGVGRFIMGGPFGQESIDVSFQRLDHFVEVGGQIVETAHSYAAGNAELALGRWLAKNRDALHVVTKVGHELQQGHDLPLSRELVREHTEAALASLNVEVIDVMLLHCDDESRSVDELAETLMGLIAAGWVRRIGISNWRSERLAALTRELAAAGQKPVVSYQFSLAQPNRSEMNPSNRAADANIREVAAEFGLPLFCWTAQASGFFARGEPKAGRGLWRMFETADNYARRDRCIALARELHSRPETIALAWTLHQPNTWPTIGPRSMEQMNLSLCAQDVRLTAAQLTWLETGY